MAWPPKVLKVGVAKICPNFSSLKKENSDHTVFGGVDSRTCGISSTLLVKKPGFRWRFIG